MGRVVSEEDASWPVQRMMEPSLRERMRVKRTEGRDVRWERRVEGFGAVEVVVIVVIVAVGRCLFSACLLKEVFLAARSFLKGLLDQ